MAAAITASDGTLANYACKSVMKHFGFSQLSIFKNQG